MTWIEKPIGELFEFKNGLNKGKEYFGHGTPIINYMDVYKKDGIYSHELHGRVDLVPQEIKRFEIRKGDVFFTRTSETPEEVGISCVLLDDVEDGVFSGFVLRGRPLADELDINYCKYCFQTAHVRSEIVNNCTYTTRALTNGTKLSKITIPVPPLSEQRTIAAALSDMDSYISALERLIAKKHNIKQGAMQELLTGKRRLPGFSGEWVQGAPFCSPDELLQGLTYSPENIREDGLLVLRSSNIQNGKLVFTDNVFVNKEVEPDRLIHKGDIIICVRNGSSALIGKCAQANHDYNATWGAFMACVRSKRHNYLYQVFQSEIIQEQIHGNSSATINQITNADFRELKIPLPPTIAEQTAIAAILSDMDAEIDALTAKLAKIRKIKQGMMQELLTGRIRLVSEDVEPSPVAKPAAKIIKLPKHEQQPAIVQTNDHNQQFAVGRK